MSDDPRERETSAPESFSGKIDEICDRFEADWKAGGRPRIEDYLEQIGNAGRASLLRELPIRQQQFVHGLGSLAVAEFPWLRSSRLEFAQPRNLDEWRLRH